MNIGYASKTLGLPEGRMRFLAMRNASDERLAEAIGANLWALEAVIRSGSGSRPSGRWPPGTRCGSACTQGSTRC